MKALIKNLIIGGGLLVLAAVGYYLFVIQGTSTLNSGNPAGISLAEVETQSFLKRLEDLQGINLSTAIFQDARFRSLQDFSTLVSRVPYSRNNPFVESSNSGR